MKKLLSFLPSGGLRYVVISAVLLTLVVLIVGGVRACKQIDADQDNQLVNAGVTQERAASQGKVLNDVQAARNAVDNPTPAAEQRVCEKYDRNCTPSN